MIHPLRRILIAVWALIGLAAPATGDAAVAIPAVPDHYVNDAAGLLSPAARDALEEKLAQFERDTSNQILVATFPDLQGESIEDFSIRLAEKWKPGQSGRDNGAILVVSKGDRKVRIEVGYGLEGAIPDATAKAILQREILPAFKQGDFEGGIRAGVEAILKATAGEYKGLPTRESYWPVLIFFAAVVLFLIFFFILFARSQSYGLYRSGAYRYGGWGGGSWGGSGGGWSGGSSSSGSSSGGFSSGGGSFGGGGASGSW